jgi:hypothetical protein
MKTDILVITRRFDRSSVLSAPLSLTDASVQSTSSFRRLSLWNEQSCVQDLPHFRVDALIQIKTSPAES